MNTETVAQALAAAREAAAAAAEVILHYWKRGVDVEIKGDATPVTVADREAEQAIRKLLHAALPEASIYGEEYGLDGARDGLLWLVDPLDGTKSFVRRTPFFSTQIALMEGDELILGVSSAPIYGEVMWASAGGGAWMDGERVQVAGTSAMSQASVSTGNVKTLTADARWDALGALIRDSNRIRGYGAARPLPHLNDIAFRTDLGSVEPDPEVVSKVELATQLGGRFGARPIELSMPVMIAPMSYGALSKSTKVALAKASALSDICDNSGEGGLIPEVREAAKRVVVQCLGGRLGWNVHAMRQARHLHLRAGEAIGDVMRRGLALDRGVHGQDDLFHLGGRGALDQPRDTEILRPDAVEGGEHAA